MMVFFLHARWPYVGGSTVTEIGGFTLLNLSRLAVPLFFLTSGYLFKMRLEAKETPEEEWAYCKKFLKKIGFYYIIGSVIFLTLKLSAVFANKFLELELVAETVSLKLQWPEILFHIFYTGDLGEHIWFLLALFYAVFLIYLFYRYDHFEKLLAGSIILHIVGVIARAYPMLDQLPVPSEDLLFFGLAFACLGFYVKDRNLDEMKSTRFFLGVAVVTNVLHLVERLFLTLSSWNTQTPFFWDTYSFLTAPAAVTVFLYTLKKTHLGKDTRINQHGRKTLWIYIIHPLPLGLLIAAVSLMNPASSFNMSNSILFTLLVTIVAYLATAELVLYSHSSSMEELKEKNKEILARLRR